MNAASTKMNEQEIIKTIYEGKKEDRISAVVALTSSKSRETLDALIYATKADSLHLRRAASIAIGKSGNVQGIPTLINLLRNDLEERVRWNAAIALSYYSTPTITDYVRNASNTNNRENWMLSFLATNKNNFPEYKTYLERGLKHSDDFIRSLTVTNIARLDWDNYRDKIIGLANDPSPAVREASYAAIWENDKEIFEKFIPQIEKDEDEHIRAFALYQKKSGESAEISTQMEDRFIACILGGAIGDALGGPIEGHRYSKIKEKFGRVKDFVNYKYTFGEPRESGEWTDDTDMALTVSQALIEQGFIHPNDLAARFGKDMRQIDINEKKQRGYAAFSISRQRKNYAGINWRFISDNSRGCGSVMRAHPIGLFYEGNNKAIIKAARDSSIVSHSGEDAIASTILLAYVVSRALHLEKGFDRNMFGEECIAFIKPYSTDLADRIANIRKDQKLEIHELAEKYGGNGHTRTVSLALECFLRYSDSYEETVTHAINHSGDSDSVGSMAGAIAGAYLGTNAIPQRYKNGVYKREMLEMTAKNLYTAYLARN